MLAIEVFQDTTRFDELPALLGYSRQDAGTIFGALSLELQNAPPHTGLREKSTFIISLPDLIATTNDLNERFNRFHARLDVARDNNGIILIVGFELLFKKENDFLRYALTSGLRQKLLCVAAFTIVDCSSVLEGEPVWNRRLQRCTMDYEKMIDFCLGEDEVCYRLNAQPSDEVKKELVAGMSASLTPMEVLRPAIDSLRLDAILDLVIKWGQRRVCTASGVLKSTTEENYDNDEVSSHNLALKSR